MYWFSVNLVSQSLLHHAESLYRSLLSIPLHFKFHNRIMVFYVGIDFWFICFPQFHIHSDSPVVTFSSHQIKSVQNQTRKSITLDSIKVYLFWFSGFPDLWFIQFQVIVGSKTTCSMLREKLLSLLLLKHQSTNYFHLLRKASRILEQRFHRIQILLKLHKWLDMFECLRFYLLSHNLKFYMASNFYE